jgi:flagellar hook protein FlgE
MIYGIGPALSALNVFSKKMRITANNVANEDTPGFKASDALFSEIAPQDIDTGSGTSQVGRGTAINNISQNFEPGALQGTDSETDLAVGGQGYFMVQSPDGNNYYTRDGHFQFDQNGGLVTSQGYAVQGWSLDPQTGAIQGTLGDININNFTSPPAQTTVARTMVNLNSQAQNNSAGVNGLSAAWDGDNPDGQYLAANANEYQSSVRVYDSLGNIHDVNISFDKGEANNQWEYIVTTNPAEDQRAGAIGNNQGLLARGTIQFSPAGSITGMTMDLNDGAGNWTPQNTATNLENGHFSFEADFLGSGNNMAVELDLGSAYNGTAWVSGSTSSTQYAVSSHTIYAGSDGYGAGDLRSIAISNDWVITGSYTNGQVTDLFQVALAKFNNPQGLQKEGANLYAATNASGEAIYSQPRTNGMGGIVSNALEQSNTDLGREFVSMILVGKGFQANLAVLKTADKMIGDLINIIT